AHVPSRHPRGGEIVVSRLHAVEALGERLVWEERPPRRLAKSSWRRRQLTQFGVPVESLYERAKCSFTMRKLFFLSGSAAAPLGLPSARCGESEALEPKLMPKASRRARKAPARERKRIDHSSAE